MVTEGIGNMYLPLLTQVTVLLKRENWCHLIFYSLCFIEPETHKLFHEYLLDERMTQRDVCLFWSGWLCHHPAHHFLGKSGPKGIMCQCVGSCGGKITWTIYAKGLSFPEGPYIFNVPMALFSKTNTGDPLGQETQIQRTMNARQNGSVLFFNHSTSIDHLPNMVLGTEQSTSDQDNLSLRTLQASGREIIIIANMYWVLIIWNSSNI